MVENCLGGGEAVATRNSGFANREICRLYGVVGDIRQGYFIVYGRLRSSGENIPPGPSPYTRLSVGDPAGTERGLCSFSHQHNFVLFRFRWGRKLTSDIGPKGHSDTQKSVATYD